MNVPDKWLGDLPDQTTYGGGAFREVRLFVDGQLAGTVFPCVDPLASHIMHHA